MLKQIIKIGVAGALLAMPVSISAASPNEIDTTMQDRVTVVLNALESDPTAEALNDLTDLLSRAQVAAEEENNEHFSEKEDVDLLLDEVNARLPFETDRAYFNGLYGWSSAEELAETWAITLPEPIGDLSRAEIRRLLEATDRHITSEKLDRFLWFLDQSLPNAFSYDLLFWPYAEWDLDGLTEEILERQSVYASGGQSALEAHVVDTARLTLEEGTALFSTLRTALRKLSPDEQAKYSAMVQKRYDDQLEQARAEQGQGGPSIDQ
ncbi:MAG: hypothetical protein AAFY42_04260 [Pseudomonadota bacterium]